MSSAKRTTAVIAGLASLALTGVPAPGMAQEDGVFVDPDSPAGKEYAVPLEEARRNSRGRDGEEGGRSGATEYRSDAFGDGIDKGDGRGSGSNGDGRRGGSDGRSGTGRDGAEGDASEDAERTSESTAAAAASGDDDDSDGGGLSGGALTVILLLLVVGGGSLLAWFLRRGQAGQTAA